MRADNCSDVQEKLGGAQRTTGDGCVGEIVSDAKKTRPLLEGIAIA